jgi:hypothetical protein
MKIAEILADGTVYWFDRANDWGTYLRSDYARHPVKRLGADRYSPTGSSWKRTFRYDPKGRYIKVVEVKEDGSPIEHSHETYLLAAQIRATMAETRELYDKRKAADKVREDARASRTAVATQTAADLSARLEALGLTDAINIRTSDGRGWAAGPPTVVVEFKVSHAEHLSVILDRLERGQRAERELAVRRADTTPDPDFADRLANGAYER